MLQIVFSYQNHDAAKLELANPTVFNIVLIGAMILLFYYPSKKNREDSLLNLGVTTELRGFAIFIIIVGHLCRHALRNKMDLPLFFDSGYIGVGVFLFLSGYGLMESYKSRGLERFFERKILRIYVPFVFFSIVWLVLDFVLLNKNQGFFNSIAVASGFLSTDRNYWYIKFLVFLYVAFYLVNYLQVSVRGKIFLLAGVSFFVLYNPTFIGGQFNAFGFFSGALVSLHSEKALQVYNTYKDKKRFYFLLVTAAIFLYGTASLFRKLDLFRALNLIQVVILSAVFLVLKRPKVWHFVSCLLFGFIASYYYVTQTNVGVMLNYSLCSLLITVFVILLFKRLKSTVSIFYHFLGEISFELYLIHGALMYSYDFILYKFPLIFSFPLYFAVIVGLAFLINRSLSLMKLGAGASGRAYAGSSTVRLQGVLTPIRQDNSLQNLPESC